MAKTENTGRRVILAYWKFRDKDNFEVFSNLKHFTASYPQYSYNTLNNYLSKGKKPFENEVLRIERMAVHNKPIRQTSHFRVVPVVQKRQLHSFDESKEDLKYWLTRSVKERAYAVAFIVNQSLQPGSKLDKSVVSKRKLHS
ncbi:MAG: hypothetical protein J7578_17760 [Chitinophagaceae bacterium]|nr:hypothetical protein [Chitinophagaceae bacterium]